LLEQAACSLGTMPTHPAAAHNTLPLLPAQATHLDSKLTLPRLGLAQLNVLQNEAVNAASLLESVLVDAPQWIDALEVRCWHRLSGTVWCAAIDIGEGRGETCQWQWPLPQRRCCLPAPIAAFYWSLPRARAGVAL